MDEQNLNEVVEAAEEIINEATSMETPVEVTTTATKANGVGWKVGFAIGVGLGIVGAKLAPKTRLWKWAKGKFTKKQEAEAEEESFKEVQEQ